MTRTAVNAPDIRFEDERLNRLMQHIRALTQEVQKLQALLDGGQAGQVLTKTTAADYDAQWQNP